VAGNMLAGARVIEATSDAYLANRDTIDADIAAAEERRKVEGRASRSHAVEFGS